MLMGRGAAKSTFGAPSPSVSGLAYTLSIHQHRPSSVAFRRTGGESGIVFRPISEITAIMEKSFYPFVIAGTFEIAAMKLDVG
jgi:hypothetical protein